MAASLRRLAAPAVLLALLLGGLPVHAGPVPSTTQDDAGSGADAPDVRELALPIALGTHAGALMAMPRAPPAGVAEDREDWYRVELGANELVEIGLRGMRDPWSNLDASYQIVMEMRDPEGRLAAFVGVPGPDVRNVVTDRAGWWYLRVWTPSMGGVHEFSIQRAAQPPQLAVAHGGAGYLALSIDIGPGGWFQYERSLTVLGRGDAAVLSDWELADPHTKLFEATTARGDGHRVRLQFGDEDVEQDLDEVEAFPRDYVLGNQRGLGNITRPGHEVWVLIVVGTEGYQQIHATWGGDVRVSAATRGDDDRVWALTSADFPAHVGIATEPTTTVLGGSAKVSAQHTLLGWFNCFGRLNACRISPPDAPAESVQGAFYDVLGGSAGPWSFERETDAGRTGAFPVLLLADVEWPGPTSP